MKCRKRSGAPRCMCRWPHRIAESTPAAGSGRASCGRHAVRWATRRRSRRREPRRSAGRRGTQRQRAVVVPAAASQPDSAAVDRQCRHQDHRRLAHRRRPAASGSAGSSSPNRPATSAPGTVFAPQQRPGAPSAPVRVTGSRTRVHRSSAGDPPGPVSRVRPRPARMRRRCHRGPRPHRGGRTAARASARRTASGTARRAASRAALQLSFRTGEHVVHHVSARPGSRQSEGPRCCGQGVNDDVGTGSVSAHGDRARGGLGTRFLPAPRRCPRNCCRGGHPRDRARGRGGRGGRRAAGHRDLRGQGRRGRPLRRGPGVSRARWRPAARRRCWRRSAAPRR